MCQNTVSGKTALAVHWAHRVAARFPDGQLYVDLRGYDPEQPVAPAAALAAFLHVLGVVGADIPHETDELAARYRSLLAGQRMLVVLDNAASAEQVRLLLAGTPTVLTVVTSRDSLTALVVRHGARRVDLDLLPPGDAIGLLRALIGGRVDAEPDAAAELADQCARLPLALRVAAELAVVRSRVPLGHLVRELADQQRRLDLMDAGGDPRTAVRAVFSWSYQHLPAAVARTFRLLGLHPGADFDRYAAAALTATTPDEVEHQLDRLTRAHLVQMTGSGPPGVGRFGMHDLLRAYAAGLATDSDSDSDPDGQRQAALTRLLDYYLATTAAAMDAVHPAERHLRPRVTAPDLPTPPLRDPATALAWLDTELPNLVAVCAYATDHGWPGHVTRLARTLFRYLDGGPYAEALTIHTYARRAAHHLDDAAAEAHALTNLGAVHAAGGRHAQAVEHYQQALTLFRVDDDRTGQARTLGNLGLAYERQGRYREAADHSRQALDLFVQLGDRIGEARALNSLGIVDGRQRHDATAADHYEQALAIFRAAGDRFGEAYALDNLGLVRGRQGHHDQAADHHRRALALYREIGNPDGEAFALDHLGLTYGRQGHHDQAIDHLQQALTRYREIGERAGEAEALNNLGETLRNAGQPAPARTQHTAALALAEETGDRYEQARAHDGIARTYDATGDRDQARRHWREALARYTDLDVPDALDIHANLKQLEQA